MSKPYGTLTFWIVIISMLLSILIAVFAVLAYLSFSAPVPSETAMVECVTIAQTSAGHPLSAERRYPSRFCGIST